MRCQKKERKRRERGEKEERKRRERKIKKKKPQIGLRFGQRKFDFYEFLTINPLALPIPFIKITEFFIFF